MAITQSNTSAGEHERVTELNLGALVADLPCGTTCEVRLVGDRAAYVLEFARHGDRWLIEGSGSAAELTGIYDDDGPVAKPERVPGWIRTALVDEFDIREVSVRR